jgi:hypothetical protein
MHSKMKHIPIKYHFLQEHIAEKNIRVEYVGTKEQVADIFTKLLPREAFEYFRQRLRVISTTKLMLLDAYLICIIFTRGSTIKNTIQVGVLVLGRVQLGGVSPRTIQLGGEAPDGNIPFSLMTKGEIFIICKGKFLEKEHRVMVLGGAMVTGGASMI